MKKSNTPSWNAGRKKAAKDLYGVVVLCCCFGCQGVLSAPLSSLRQERTREQRPNSSVITNPALSGNNQHQVTEDPPDNQLSDICDDVVDGPSFSPIRRLSRREYNNTIFDLLGDGSRPGDDFITDFPVNGFHNNGAASIVDAMVVEGSLGSTLRSLETALHKPPVSQMHQWEAEMVGLFRTVNDWEYPENEGIITSEGTRHLWQASYLVTKAQKTHGGIYRVSVTGYAKRTNSDYTPFVDLEVGNELVARFEIDTTTSKTFSAEVELPAVEDRIRLLYQPPQVLVYELPLLDIPADIPAQNETECAKVSLQDGRAIWRDQGYNQKCRRLVQCSTSTTCPMDERASPTVPQECRELEVPTGSHDRVKEVYPDLFTDIDNPPKFCHWVHRMVSVRIDSFSIEGPLSGHSPENPQRKLIFICDPETSGTEACSREILRTFFPQSLAKALRVI